jgi:hypothetical protein
MKVSFAPLKQDAVVLLTDRIGIDFTIVNFASPHWFCVTARNDEGTLMGVLACEFISWFEAVFNTAIIDQRCMSRRLLVAMFTALFSQAVRLTAQVDVNNARAIRQMGRMGFVYEGFCRKGINGNRDAYTFGMLKDDCKFLPGYTGGTTVTLEFDYGQDTKAA